MCNRDPFALLPAGVDVCIVSYFALCQISAFCLVIMVNHSLTHFRLDHRSAFQPEPS